MVALYGWTWLGFEAPVMPKPVVAGFAPNRLDEVPAPNVPVVAGFPNSPPEFAG